MNILICNLASPANPGDQAILRGTLKLVRKFQPDARIVISTRAYSQKSVYEALGCEVVPSYPDVDCMAMNDSFQKVLRIPQAILKPGLLYEEVKKSDLVLFAGGAYFYSYRKLIPGLTFLAHLSAAEFARRLGKPLVFLPQSYGPFYSKISEKMFRFAALQARYVFYREELTGEWLSQKEAQIKSKIHFMPDLALYLKKEDLVQAKAEKPQNSRLIIGLTVRPWAVDNKDAASYFKMLTSEVIKFARENDAVIRVIVQVMDAKDYEGDENVSRELVRDLEKGLNSDQVEFYVRRPYFELEELCRLYSECDGMICMRLHSALLSYVVGVPAGVVGYQHKSEGILKALELTDLYLGSYDEVSSAKIKNYFSKILARRNEMSLQILERLNDAYDKIEQQGKRFLT